MGTSINYTEQLFTCLYAFGVGWAIAYVVKHISQLIERFGWLLFIIIGLPIMMGLVMAAAVISDYHNLAFSCAFLLGFVLRMIKRRA